MVKSKLKRNLYLIYTFSFFAYFNGFTLIQALYFNELLNSLSLAMSILGLIPIYVIILEVPTGILSDNLGRKKTMIAGIIAQIISIGFYYLASKFYPYPMLATGAFFTGLTISLFSGTNEAFTFETTKALDNEDTFANIWGKVKSTIKFSESISAVIAGTLAYKYSYNLVLAMTAICSVLALISCLFLKNVKEVKKVSKENYISTIKAAFIQFIKNKRLRNITLCRSFSMSLHDATHKLEVVYFETLVPLQFVGYARALKKFFSSISFWFAHKFINKFGNKNALYITEYFGASVKLVGLLLNNILSPFIIAFENFGYSSSVLNYTSLSQNEFSNEERATMASLSSLISSLILAISLTLIGYLADITDIRFALITFTCLVYLLPLLIRKIFKKEIIKQAAE